MTGNLYLCRVVIGGECRKFVPCVVFCGTDLDRLHDFLQFVYCTVYIFLNSLMTFEFRSNLRAVDLYSLWLGLITTGTG